MILVAIGNEWHTNHQVLVERNHGNLGRFERGYCNQGCDRNGRILLTFFELGSRLRKQIGKGERESGMGFKRILVPLDGSKLAERAGAPAVALAKTMPASITFLRVAVPLPLNIDPDLYQRVIKIRIGEAERYLEKAQYRCSSPPVKIGLDTVVGSPVRSIIKYVQENGVDLIVMSSHGRSGVSRLRYGSIAERVLRSAPCATAIIRAQIEIEPFAHKHILVPLDGSPLAEQALGPAIDVAKAVAAQLTLLRVTCPAPRRAFGLARLKTKDWLRKIDEKTGMEATVYLQNVQVTLSRCHVPIKVVSETGADVAKTIIDQSDRLQADLIIMSRQRRSVLNRWVFGSVTEKVVREANSATLVIQDQKVSK